MSGDVPTRYTQMYHNYDKAFVDKVHSIKVFTQDRSKNDVEYGLPCVWASPDRAFGQIRRQIARKNQVKESEVKTIPLPIASLSRINQNIDLTRYVRFKFNRLKYVPTEQKYIGMDRPNPWDMVYQIDVWAKTIQDLDMITTQINMWLRADEFYLRVAHPSPMDERIVLTQFQGMVENSKLDTGQEEKRTLRRTFTFVVHGWVIHPPDEYGIVRRIIVDFYDMTLSRLDPVFLERLVILPDEEDIEPEDEIMGTVATSFYGVLIVGEAQVNETYGSFEAPVNALITGMQINVLGRPPTGDDLEFQLTVNGLPDTSRYVTVSAGDRQESVIFGSERRIVAGDMLGVKCVSVGGVDPGDWIEVRFDATLDVSATT